MHDACITLRHLATKANPRSCVRSKTQCVHRTGLQESQGLQVGPNPWPLALAPKRKAWSMVEPRCKCIAPGFLNASCLSLLPQAGRQAGSQPADHACVAQAICLRKPVAYDAAATPCMQPAAARISRPELGLDVVHGCPWPFGPYCTACCSRNQVACASLQATCSWPATLHDVPRRCSSQKQRLH